MNISSLPYHFDNFQQLLLNLKIDFDIIDITESRIKSEKAPANSTDLIKYNTNKPQQTQKREKLCSIFQSSSITKGETICKSQNQSKLNQ